MHSSYASINKRHICHICRASPVMQDRADAVARKVLRLLETGHKELVVALNNALIKEGRFEPAVKMAGEWRTDEYTGAHVLYLATGAAAAPEAPLLGRQLELLSQPARAPEGCLSSRVRRLRGGACSSAYAWMPWLHMEPKPCGC